MPLRCGELRKRKDAEGYARAWCQGEISQVTGEAQEVDKHEDHEANNAEREEKEGEQGEAGNAGEE